MVTMTTAVRETYVAGQPGETLLASFRHSMLLSGIQADLWGLSRRRGPPCSQCTYLAAHQVTIALSSANYPAGGVCTMDMLLQLLTPLTYKTEVLNNQLLPLATKRTPWRA